MRSQSRQASAVKYYAKAFSNFHQINAFEEAGFLILDLCCADDGKALDIYTLQNLRKSGEALDKVSSAQKALSDSNVAVDQCSWIVLQPNVTHFHDTEFPPPKMT